MADRRREILDISRRLAAFLNYIPADSQQKLRAEVAEIMAEPGVSAAL